MKLLYLNLILLPALLFAASDIEKLQARLEKTSGEERIRLRVEIAGLYGFFDLAKADSCFRLAVKEARQLGAPRLVGDITFAFGRHLYYKGFLDTAVVYLKESLKIREAIADSGGIGRCLSHLGLVYKLFNQKALAIKYLEQALTIQRQLGDKEEQGKILTNLGNISREASNYKDALRFFTEALEVNRQINSTEGLAWLNFSLGLLYRDLKDYPKALEHVKKSLHYYRILAEGTEDTGGIRICYGQLSELYCLMGKYQQGLEYSLKVLELQKKSGVAIAIADGMKRVANAYFALENYPQALDYALRSMELRQTLKDQSGATENLRLIGNIYQRLGQPKKAIQYLKKGLASARQRTEKRQESDILEMIAAVFEESHATDSAHYYLRQYTDLHEQVFSEEISSRIAALQVQYELKEQEFLNQQLKQNVRIKELEINRQKNIRNYTIGMAVTAAIALLALILLYRYKVRDNRLLQQAHDELSQEIEERKAVEKERERLIQEQQEALAKIKTLSGLIPICSYCKKIRNDKGYYEQLEKYISEHSAAVFTHGICPECMEKYHAEYLKKNRVKTASSSE